MRLPVGARRWIDDQTGRYQQALGGNFPINYQDLDSEGLPWREILPQWDQVNPTRWALQAAGHRAVIEADGGLLARWRDRSGTWRSLGIRPDRLVKFKLSDFSWTTLATSSPTSVTVQGSAAIFENVYPGVERRVEIFNNRIWDMLTFSQSARDQLAGAGPWSGHLVGTVNEIDPSGLGLTWRDAAGRFTIDGNGRAADYVELEKDGTRVFRLNPSFIYSPSEIPTLDDAHKVRKFFVVRNSRYYLVELFDPIVANQLPAGDLIHFVDFGETTSGGAFSSTCSNYAQGSVFTTSVAGTLDEINVWGRYNKGGFPLPLPLDGFGAVLNVADPVLGSTARETDEDGFASGSASPFWNTLNYSTSESVAASTDYVVAAWAALSSPHTMITYFDTGATNQCRQASSTYVGPGSWPDMSTKYALEMTIYATYTEATAATKTLLLLGVG